MFGLLGSKLVQELAIKAGKVAGQWVAEKVAAATEAAIAKARQIADAVDRAARERVRSAINEGADAASNAVGKISQGYQDAKAAILDGAQAVSDAVDAVKDFFGMEPAGGTAEPCPASVPFAEAPDGALMVATDKCPADAIPVGKGGAKQALEQAKAMSPPSARDCCAGKSEAERNRTIIYANGIMTSPEAHCNTLRKLRDMTCGKVIGVLNRSEGAVTDIVRTNDARMRIKAEIGGGPATKDYAGFSPAVNTMKNVLTLQAASGEPTTIFAHSEGGAITSLAAIRAKETLKNGGLHDAMGNLEIVSMGAAAPAWPDGPNYTHYVHVQDIVPNAVGLGDAAKRPGAGAKVVHFGGRDGEYRDSPTGDKRPYIPITPKLDPIADHYADSSYLPYINKQSGGCLDKS